MINERKTYGVHGMMEWQAIIRCGQASVKVPFTGGSLTGYGVVPAKFTTEDPMKQLIIENSEYFKNGKIKLVSVTEGSGKYKSIDSPNHADAGTQKPGQASTASAIMDSALNPTSKDQSADVSTETENSDDDGKIVIEVSDIDDARDYLVEEFDITRSSLRSNVSVYRAAEEHNIVFKGLEE